MATFSKLVTESDENKFRVPQSWLGTLLPGDLEPGSRTDILLRDHDSGNLFPVILKVRKCHDIDLNREPKPYYEKPEFMAQGWKDFVNKKGLEAGHTIYFMRDVGGHIRVHVDYTKKKNVKA